MLLHCCCLPALLLLQVTEVPAFSAEANALLDALADNFSVADAQEVRQGRWWCPSLQQ
jgi:hypothetical protein